MSNRIHYLSWGYPGVPDKKDRPMPVIEYRGITIKHDPHSGNSLHTEWKVDFPDGVHDCFCNLQHAYDCIDWWYEMIKFPKTLLVCKKDYSKNNYNDSVIRMGQSCVLFWCSFEKNHVLISEPVESIEKFKYWRYSDLYVVPFNDLFQYFLVKETHDKFIQKSVKKLKALEDKKEDILKEVIFRDRSDLTDNIDKWLEEKKKLKDAK